MEGYAIGWHRIIDHWRSGVGSQWPLFLPFNVLRVVSGRWRPRASSLALSSPSSSPSDLGAELRLESRRGLPQRELPGGRVATGSRLQLGWSGAGQIDKLKALFKVSERVKIDDIASMLGTSRKDAFDKLLVLSKTVNFQINEDVVIRKRANRRHHFRAGQAIRGVGR